MKLDLDNAALFRLRGEIRHSRVPHQGMLFIVFDRAIGEWVVWFEGVDGEDYFLVKYLGRATWKSSRSGLIAFPTAQDAFDQALLVGTVVP